MRITFTLPGSARAPVGGVKVVYEYANRLALRGHEVTVVHAPISRTDPPLLMIASAAVRYPQRLLDRSYRPDRWMSVVPSVVVKWVPSFAERFLPDADVIVATAWRTAEWVLQLSKAKGRKFYLIQHYEVWDGDVSRVNATWRAPLHKIVIAHWLQEKAQELGESASYIPNGLDFTKFGVDTPIEMRPRATALMLVHDYPWKGSKDGVLAAQLVHAKLPGFRLILFGRPGRPRGMPSWATYYRDPSQLLLRCLYNKAAVFIAPSLTEGWGLTESEAMMSGLALACTDIDGHREYACDGVTALLSAPSDPASLARNVLRLCRDNSLRRRIAYSGNCFIKRFTWDNAVIRFEQIISNGNL